MWSPFPQYFMKSELMIKMSTLRNHFMVNELSFGLMLSHKSGHRPCFCLMSAGNSLPCHLTVSARRLPYFWCVPPDQTTYNNVLLCEVCIFCFQGFRCMCMFKVSVWILVSVHNVYSSHFQYFLYTYANLFGLHRDQMLPELIIIFCDPIYSWSYLYLQYNYGCVL